MSYTIDLLVDQVAPADEVASQYCGTANRELPVYSFGGVDFIQSPISDSFGKNLPPSVATRLSARLSLHSEALHRWRFGKMNPSERIALTAAFARILHGAGAWVVHMAPRRGSTSKAIESAPDDIIGTIESYFTSDAEAMLDEVLFFGRL